MTNQFIIATDKLTAEQERELAKELSAAIWWHWLPNFWLVVDESEKLTVSKISAAVRKVSNAQCRCLVLQVESKTWSAQTRKDAKGDDMVDWIREQWKS